MLLAIIGDTMQTIKDDIKMKNKKGVELSFNTIIIAILALIVLIVIVLVLTGKLGKTGEEMSKVEKSVSLENCNIPGYRKCVSAAQCPPGKELAQFPCAGGQYCCLLSDLVG